MPVCRQGKAVVIAAERAGVYYSKVCKVALNIAVLRAVFEPRYARIGVCHSAYYHTKIIFKLGSALKHVAYAVYRQLLARSTVVFTVHGNFVARINKIFFNLLVR